VCFSERGGEKRNTVAKSHRMLYFAGLKNSDKLQSVFAARDLSSVLKLLSGPSSRPETIAYTCAGQRLIDLQTERGERASEK